MTERSLSRLQCAARALGALSAAALCICSVCPHDALAAASSSRFDGQWDTVLSCSNSNGALGYSFDFLSVVKDGVLHGEKGERGKPGWLQLDGKIEPSGSASLYAQGVVGAAAFAVGQRPAGTEYAYHLDVEFSDASGKGHRVEGRPCSVVFSRK